MRYIAGLDIGSAFSKAVIMRDGKLQTYTISTTGGNFSKSAEDILSVALKKLGLYDEDIDAVGGCGIGAAFINRPFIKITELSCQSRGTHFLLPGTRSLIEIGNQSSRLIKVTAQGKVAGSLITDKCAAGSGRVLQIIAKVLGIRFEEMGALSKRSNKPAKFTTNCAVFLETEAISRVAEGTPVKDIVAGLHQTLAAKIAGLAQRFRVEDECALTGGGALDQGLLLRIQKQMGRKIIVPHQPMITGAIGAALIVEEKEELKRLSAIQKSNTNESMT